MKNLFGFLTIMILISGCAPSETAIQTAISKTQAAWTATYTATFAPSKTSIPTRLPATSAPTATVGLGSMHKPYPMMTAVSLAVNNPGEVDFSVTVLEIARGPAVDAYVTSNFPGVNPNSGKQFIFVKVDVNIIGVASGSSYPISGANFQTASDGQLSAPQYIDYMCYPNCSQYPLLSANFVAPGHTTGWVMLQVFSDDPHPLMVMGPFYFSLE